jgi:hypothetical protein
MATTEVSYEHTMVHVILGGQGELDKRDLKVTSSKLFLKTNGVPVLYVEVLLNSTVSIILANALTIPLGDYRTIRHGINLWIRFIQKELGLVALSTLKHTQNIDIDVNRTTITFDSAVFNPGNKKVVDGEWTKSTGLIDFKALPAQILPWGDFLTGQKFIDDVVETIVLL